MMIDPFGLEQRRLKRIYEKNGIEAVLRELKP